MSPRSTLRLLDAITRIRAYRASEAALDDEAPVDLVTDAILRRLAIIGEAAAQLPPEVRERAPDIAWRDVIGLRNRVVHDYDAIDWAIIDDVIEHDLSALTQRIESLRALADEEPM